MAHGVIRLQGTLLLQAGTGHLKTSCFLSTVCIGMASGSSLIGSLQISLMTFTAWSFLTEPTFMNMRTRGKGFILTGTVTYSTTAVMRAGRFSAVVLYSGLRNTMPIG